MSTSIYKIEYDCDCGVDYGSCGAKCAVILKSNNSCDVYTWYHTDSHEHAGNKNNPNTEYGLPIHFGYSLLIATRKAIELKSHNGETLTESEWKFIKENR